jgi:hypothetical protein
MWRNNFGKNLATSAGASAAGPVPEPTLVATLLPNLFFLARRRAHDS